MDRSWKYSPRFFPKAPVINLELEDMPLECLIDTGFGGALLIPYPLFESLGLLSKLLPNSYTVVMPDSRKLPLYSSKAKVVIGELTLETEVHSSPSIKKKLVGRIFLREFAVKLDGKKERLHLSQ